MIVTDEGVYAHVDDLILSLFLVRDLDGVRKMYAKLDRARDEDR